jgi:hypothetical protein
MSKEDKQSEFISVIDEFTNQCQELLDTLHEVNNIFKSFQVSNSNSNSSLDSIPDNR